MKIRLTIELDYDFPASFEELEQITFDNVIQAAISWQHEQMMDILSNSPVDQTSKLHKFRSAIDDGAYHAYYDAAQRLKRAKTYYEEAV